MRIASLVLSVILCLLCGRVAHTKEVVYRINAPIHKLVHTLLNQPQEKIEIPGIVKEADLVLEAKIFPHRGYYKFSARLLTQRNIVTGFSKQIELWDRGDHTVVRAYIDLSIKRNRFPLRWVNIIKDRVVDGIENEVLIVERAKLEGFAK